MNIVQAVRWTSDPAHTSSPTVTILDQRELPQRTVERELRTVADVEDAIRTLAVRGAPAIGIAGAMGLVAATPVEHDVRDAYLARLERHAATIRGARPTAVNLPWAIDRMLASGRATSGDARAIHARLIDEATAILDEDRAMCAAIGEHGVGLIPDRARIITHCNTGALATGGIGTALAPIYLAAERGKQPTVYADETRPLLQGSRLTAWELSRAGIPVHVMADSAAASLMGQGDVDLIIVGADRIAANGDVANKIGTFPLAIAAHYHGIPFYVAAPSSTIDPATPSGGAIHIEQRAADEVRSIGGRSVAPEGVAVYNPAFDVTPAALITALITDVGVHRPPYHFAHASRPRD